MASKKKSYASQVAAVAPAFTLKALVGDLPKGSVEKLVEGKLKGSKESTKNLLKSGIKGRGSGRALGAALGVASAPMFLGGLKLVGSKNKKDQAKGLAMIGASAGTYQSVKGFTEGYREARAGNAKKAKSIIEGIRLGGIRMGYKTPAALALGLGIAAGRKKSKKNSSSKFIIPGLTGAAIGAASRGGEGLAKDILAKKGLGASIKNVLPRAGGGAASGLLGGLVLGGIIDSAMKSLEKKGSVEELMYEAESLTKESAVGVGMITAKALADLVAVHGATKASMGYGRIGQTFGRTRIGRSVQKKMELAKEKQLAIGLREGIAGRTTSGMRSQLAFNVGVPELKMQRALGIGLGKLIRRLPKDKQIEVLKGAKAFVKRNPALRTTARGESIAILNQIPGAVDMALGAKKLPGNKLMNAALYGGRGGLGKGLPKAGRQDAKGIISGDNLVNIGSGAAGLAGLGAVAVGAAPALAVLPAAHLGMSGIKNLVTQTKAISDMGMREGARGIREALLPGIKKSYGLGTKAGDKATDYILSPGARDYGRMIGGLSAGAVAAGNKRLKGAALQKYINRAASPERISMKDAITAPVAAGTGIGALLNVRSRRRSKRS